MKRVLMIASVPSMIGQFNMGNIRLLQELGYQVDVACDFMDRSVWTEERAERLIKELKESGAGICQVDFSRSVWRINRHIRAWKQLRKILREKKYEFLHCHTPIAGALGRIAGHQEQVKVIYTAHGFHFYQGAPLKNWLLYYPVEKYLSSWTDVLITINKEDYERAVKRFKAKKIKYVPGVGIDLETIQNTIAHRNKKREELGIEEETVALLSVGELSKNKNHIAVIKALANLKDKRIQYFICGQGKLKEYLTEESKRLSMEKQVHLLGYRRDVYEIYKACDIFVHPSYREGLSVAVMEAMASGLPCLVSDIRGNRDLIINGKNGILFSLKNQKKLENDIGYLRENYDKFRKYTENNSINVKQYSKDFIIEQMAKIYSGISSL